MKDLSDAGQMIASYARQHAVTLAQQLHDAALDDATAIAAIAKKAGSDVLKSTPAKDLRTRLLEIEPLVESIAASCKPVFDAVAQAQLPTLNDALACGLSFKAAYDAKIVDSVKGAAKAASDLAGVAATAAASVKTEIQAMLPDLETVKLAGSKIDAIKSQWEKVAAFFGVAAPAGPGTFVSDQQTDRTINDIVDTSIDLTCTSRKEGDYLRFQPSLMGGTKAIEVGTSDTMRIVRNGAHLEVSAAVMFLEEPNNGHWDFKTAPGVVAAIHYHDARGPGDAHGCTFWNALDLGLGLHFSYPDFGGEHGGTNPSFELGVGGTVLAFGDLLQAGYGFDIQAGVKYWYIGFGLDSLAHLGVTYDLPKH